MLPATRLGLELALLQDAPDLRELVRLIQADPVAVLHLFAAVSRVCGVAAIADEHPVRLEEFIILIGKEDLLSILCRQVPTTSAKTVAAVTLAHEARVLGRMCQVVAEALGLPEEEAYLIGLLHRVDALQARPVCGDAADLCAQYDLPLRLENALLHVARVDSASPWTAVVRAAEELLDRYGYAGPTNESRF